MLIRLHVCSAWSEPLLFANRQRQRLIFFSCGPYHTIRCGPYHTIRYRGSYMSAHILLNISNELVKSHTMWGLTSILPLFHNKFHTFYNTRAQMFDSIWFYFIIMTLRFTLFLPNSGIVFMASSYKAYIQCNRFLLYIFICFYSECIVVASSIQIDTQFWGQWKFHAVMGWNCNFIVE